MRLNKFNERFMVNIMVLLFHIKKLLFEERRVSYNNNKMTIYCLV